MLNKVQLIGHMGGDPKISTTANTQTIVAAFSLATTERGYKSSTGADVPERTEWHNIVAYGKLAEILQKYTFKGSKIYLEGKLRTRSYEDKQGAKRYITEVYADVVELLDSKKENRTYPEPAPAPAKPDVPAKAVEAPAQAYAQNIPDDLPF